MEESVALEEVSQHSLCWRPGRLYRPSNHDPCCRWQSPIGAAAVEVTSRLLFFLPSVCYEGERIDDLLSVCADEVVYSDAFSNLVNPASHVIVIDFRILGRWSGVDCFLVLIG